MTRTDAGRCRPSTVLAHLCHCCAEVGAFEPTGHDDQTLQVFATDFVLRRKLLDGGQRAKRRRVA